MECDLKPQNVNLSSIILFGKRHDQFPRAGAVEFGEEDFLPLADDWMSVLDQHLLAIAHQNRFDMRSGVALAVRVVAPPGDSFFEGGFDVAHHVGIVPFVDEDSRRGVGDL